MPLANIEVQEVRHATVTQPIDNVADSSARDEAEGACGQAIFGAAHPDYKGENHTYRDRHQNPGPRFTEQAEAYARVAPEDEIEEPGYWNHAWRVHDIVQDPPLRRLIDGEPEERDGKSEP